MAVKIFACAVCDATGKIILKNDDLTAKDCAFCPVCSAQIYQDEDIDFEDDE